MWNHRLWRHWPSLDSGRAQLSLSLRRSFEVVVTPSPISTMSVASASSATGFDPVNARLAGVVAPTEPVDPVVPAAGVSDETG